MQEAFPPLPSASADEPAFGSRRPNTTDHSAAFRYASGQEWPATAALLQQLGADVTLGIPGREQERQRDDGEGDERREVAEPRPEVLGTQSAARGHAGRVER